MQNSLPVLLVKQCPTPTLLTLQLWKATDYGKTVVHADNQQQWNVQVAQGNVAFLKYPMYCFLKEKCTKNWGHDCW